MRVPWIAGLVCASALASGCASPVTRQVGVTGPSRAQQLADAARRLPAGRAVYWLGPSASVYWTFGTPLPATPWICQEPSVPGAGRVAFCTVTYLRPRPPNPFRPAEYQLVVRLREAAGEEVLVYARVAAVDPALGPYARTHVRRYPTSASVKPS